MNHKAIYCHFFRILLASGILVLFSDIIAYQVPDPADLQITSTAPKACTTFIQDNFKNYGSELLYFLTLS
jgi:hypothetical protein